jgi:hypothetical protein
LVFLKGPSGVGKTHHIKNLEPSRYCLYEATQILDWINHQDQRTALLLLDEANLEPDGTYNFLKGLYLSDGGAPYIFYQGEFYSLAPDNRHTIIVTGNAESFPNRHYHTFFQHYAETVWVKEPSDHFLCTQTILPVINPIMLPLTIPGYDNPISFVSTVLIQIYHFVKSLDPQLLLTLRDLNNFTYRFAWIFNTQKNPLLIQQYLHQAALGEFSGRFSDPEIRQQFITQLQPNFLREAGFSPPTQSTIGILELTPHYKLPSTKAYLLDTIQQSFLLRQYTMSSPETHTEKSSLFKMGILLEGDSGTGKSTLFRTFLETRGFSEQSPDPQSRFYECHAGMNTQELSQLLLKAFHEGSVVILNELNLDDRLESLLNALLTGHDLEGKQPTLPGFRLLASQNPGFFTGRKALSPALRNRVESLHFDPFTRDELTAIAQQAHVAFADAFVDAYVSVRRGHPAINARTFFQQLPQQSNRKRVYDLDQEPGEESDLPPDHKRQCGPA